MEIIKSIVNSLQHLTGHNLKIRINKSFVRKNDIDVLYGSTKKLKNCMGEIQNIDIEDTLRWILSGK